MNDLNQYGRRDSVEILNLSEDITQSKLENYVINFLRTIDVHVQPDDIIAVHRLGKYNAMYNRNIIIKFLNRKNSINCLKNRKKIKKLSNKYNNLYIIDNLSPYNKKIFNKLYKMKQDDSIFKVWSYNGGVYAVFKEGGYPAHI